jgi:hypothetical protein
MSHFSTSWYSDLLFWPVTKMTRPFNIGPRHRPVLNVTISTGWCLDPVLNDSPRVTLKWKHLPPNHMWCIGGLVRKVHTRLEVVSLNPTDRARAKLGHVAMCLWVWIPRTAHARNWDLWRGACAVASLGVRHFFYFLGVKHCRPVLNDPFSIGRFSWY